MSSSIHFSQLCRDARISIIEFAGVTTSLPLVCRSWDSLINHMLQDFWWESMPRQLKPLTTSIHAKIPDKDDKNYFRHYRVLSCVLLEKLETIDPISKARACQMYRGSLSPDRVLFLHEEIATLKCILKVWQTQIAIQISDDFPQKLQTASAVRAACMSEENLSKFKMATTLSLHGEHLSTVPREFHSFNCMTCLDLSDNNLRDFPATLCDAFKCLQVLDLSGNPLNAEKYLEIARNICDLTALRTFKSDNPTFVIVVNRELQESSALCKIWNRLFKNVPGLPEVKRPSQVRAAFGDPKNRMIFCGVDSLDLSHSELSVVPSAITALKNLKELDLSHNPILEIPSEITQLGQLEMLNLEHTHLPRRLYPQICEILATNPSLRVVKHHSKEFRFRSKQWLMQISSMTPLPPPALGNAGTAIPAATPQPAAKSSACAIL